MKIPKFLAKLFEKHEKKEDKPTQVKNMKHVQIFQEIDAKIHEMCHEALLFGGVHLLNAVNQLANAITQIVGYQKAASPEAPPKVD